MTVTLASEIHQNLAHQPRRDAKEMRPILPVDLLGIHQPQVRLIDQRRSLQADLAPFVRQMPVRQPVQFLIHERRQLFERSFIACIPSAQQGRDFLWRRERYRLFWD